MPKDSKTGLTVKKLMVCKKELDEAERRRPKIYIDSVEYIIFKPKQCQN